MGGLTGIPLEHEIPAPVTTTIFLHFATESERLDSVRLLAESEAHLSRSRVMVILAHHTWEYKLGRRWWVDGKVRWEVAGLEMRLMYSSRRVAHHVITTRSAVMLMIIVVQI